MSADIEWHWECKCDKYHAYAYITEIWKLLGYGVAHLEGIAGLSAWRWLYLLEGILTCVSAIVAFFCLPGWPEQARFLDQDEKDGLLVAIDQSSRDNSDPETTWTVFVSVLRDPKVYSRYVRRFTGKLRRGMLTLDQRIDPLWLRSNRNIICCLPAQHITRARLDVLQSRVHGRSRLPGCGSGVCDQRLCI